MQKKRPFSGKFQSAEETKRKTYKVEKDEELSVELKKSIRVACDSMIKGELKWIPPLYFVCNCELNDSTKKIREEVKKCSLEHEKHECNKKECGCEILQGIRLCGPVVSSDDHTEKETFIIGIPNDYENPVAQEMFGDLFNDAHQTPLAFLKKYRFLPWQAENFITKSTVPANQLEHLLKDFEYNPFLYGNMYKMCFGMERERLDRHANHIRWALSTCRNFGPNLGDINIWGSMREKIESEGNSSLTAIFEREERRKSVKSLILCARKFSQGSPFYEEELPLDMLKIIVTLAGLMPPQWFY